MLVGAALLAVGLTVISGISYALADVPSRLDPVAAQTLNVLSNDVFYTLRVGGCVFGIAILRGARLPNLARLGTLDRRRRAFHLGAHRQHPDLQAQRHPSTHPRLKTTPSV
jgi:hypothetical protein